MGNVSAPRRSYRLLHTQGPMKAHAVSELCNFMQLKHKSGADRRQARPTDGDRIHEQLLPYRRGKPLERSSPESWWDGFALWKDL